VTRDPDPPENQVRILFGKNGGRCAYTACGLPLVISSQNRADHARNTGKIAHITAASPGGPRYDPNLTVAERRSEANLILLCGSHHDVVDAQLTFHTTEWLHSAKKTHETAVARGYSYAMGKVGFAHLEMVCMGINICATGGMTAIDNLTIPIDIEEKITLNLLGGESRNLIELGMAQQSEVRRFIAQMNQLHPNFSYELTAKFKGIYYLAFSEGSRGDDLFRDILGSAYENCGVALSPEVGAAALAVVVELFSICEIFDHEPTAAG
jgi:hypothetical protein